MLVELEEVDIWNRNPIRTHEDESGFDHSKKKKKVLRRTKEEYRLGNCSGVTQYDESSRTKGLTYMRSRLE